MHIPVPAKPKKRLGQNFLNDENVLHKLLQLIGPAPSDVVVEIGAGTGALTSRLAPHVGKVFAIELDAALIPYLSAIPGVEVINQDVLKVSVCGLAPGSKLRLTGNLPYYLSTSIMTSMLKQIDCINDMVFLFQEEVAQRITAANSTSEYGYLSVVVQYFCEISKGFKIGRNSFSPRPEVHSRVLHFVPKKQMKFGFGSYGSFVEKAFSQRRKQLRNNLARELNISAGIVDEALMELGIRTDARAENLSPQQFEDLLLLLAAQLSQN